MKIVSKIALVATFGLALAFTFSCSDDDKKGGGWVTCEEFFSISDKCRSKYKAELDACNDEDDCVKAYKDKFNKCVESDACTGTSREECWAHYKSNCIGE